MNIDLLVNVHMSGQVFATANKGWLFRGDVGKKCRKCKTFCAKVLAMNGNICYDTDSARALDKNVNTFRCTSCSGWGKTKLEAYSIFFSQKSSLGCFLKAWRGLLRREPGRDRPKKRPRYGQARRKKRNEKDSCPAPGSCDGFRLRCLRRPACCRGARYRGPCDRISAR